MLLEQPHLSQPTSLSVVSELTLFALKVHFAVALNQ